jgi:hypothetical protein
MACPIRPAAPIIASFMDLQMSQWVSKLPYSSDAGRHKAWRARRGAFFACLCQAAMLHAKT